MFPSVSAEVNHHYLSFDGIELKVQRTIPTVFNPLPVRSFIPFTDETNDCSVISKFNDGVRGVGRCTIISVWVGVQERAQHTALVGACAEGHGGEACSTSTRGDLDRESLIQAQVEGGQTDINQLVNQNFRNDGLEC